jgi:hypothetical protein
MPPNKIINTNQISRSKYTPNAYFIYLYKKLKWGKEIKIGNKMKGGLGESGGK